ncbi:MAG TPA: GNAT family N-acetyltransferase [Firmicutes bacterium]|nr:GNAT family N-acetyltransferase [Bacillota bacterium]
MNIRSMSISDYDEVYSLWRSLAGMRLNDTDFSKDGIARVLDRNPETCFVAEDDGKIIGAVIAGSDGRRGYIYHTAVSKEHRRQKVGTKLLDSCLGAFKRHGIIKSAIVVFSSNKDGNAFWKKNGFSVRNDLLYRDKVLLEPGMV